MLSKHHNETGTYNTHVYVDGKFYGGVVPIIKPSSAVVTAPSSVNLSEGSYEVTIDGVNSEVAQVLFPTWTEANGQDDLEQPWIQGTKVNEHKWKIIIPFSKHGNESGKYITHIYAKDNYGNVTIIGANLTDVIS
ncbi:GBS Bsp-like repeat-containing protein [Paenibacillus oralis]|uniref:GBS Bsp-like repeat-containing protein n=1 Tax=Paenibacillus oralis TaxID=2490856 RepID=UPI0015B086F6|nr:GBS Bsp-like repeat-containing protein [Paenibacillus oralis]